MADEKPDGKFLGDAEEAASWAEAARAAADKGKTPTAGSDLLEEAAKVFPEVKEKVPDGPDE